MLLVRFFSQFLLSLFYAFFFFSTMVSSQNDPKANHRDSTEEEGTTTHKGRGRKTALAKRTRGVRTTSTRDFPYFQFISMFFIFHFCMYFSFFYFFQRELFWLFNQLFHFPIFIFCSKTNCFLFSVWLFLPSSEKAPFRRVSASFEARMCGLFLKQELFKRCVAFSSVASASLRTHGPCATGDSHLSGPPSLNTWLHWYATGRSRAPRTPRVRLYTGAPGAQGWNQRSWWRRPGEPGIAAPPRARPSTWRHWGPLPPVPTLSLQRTARRPISRRLGQGPQPRAFLSCAQCGADPGAYVGGTDRGPMHGTYGAQVLLAEFFAQLRQFDGSCGEAGPTAAR